MIHWCKVLWFTSQYHDIKQCTNKKSTLLWPPRKSKPDHVEAKTLVRGCGGNCLLQFDTKFSTRISTLFAFWTILWIKMYFRFSHFNRNDADTQQIGNVLGQCSNDRWPVDYRRHWSSHIGLSVVYLRDWDWNVKNENAS